MLTRCVLGKGIFLFSDPLCEAHLSWWTKILFAVECRRQRARRRRQDACWAQLKDENVGRKRNRSSFDPCGFPDGKSSKNCCCCCCVLRRNRSRKWAAVLMSFLVIAAPHRNDPQHLCSPFVLGREIRLAFKSCLIHFQMIILIREGIEGHDDGMFQKRKKKFLFFSSSHEERKLPAELKVVCHDQPLPCKAEPL